MQKKNTTNKILITLYSKTKIDNKVKLLYIETANIRLHNEALISYTYGTIP